MKNKSASTAENNSTDFSGERSFCRAGDQHAGEPLKQSVADVLLTEEEGWIMEF